MSAYDSNLLQDALDVIGRQTFLYYQFMGRTTNSIGIDVAARSPAVTVTGSFQPVPRTLYAVMGLDLQKYYAQFFVPQNVIDIERDSSGDQFAYNGKLFQVESRTDWHGVNGWVSLLAVQVFDDGSDANTYVIDPESVFVVEP